MGASYIGTLCTIFVIFWSIQNFSKINFLFSKGNSGKVHLVFNISHSLAMYEIIKDLQFNHYEYEISFNIFGSQMEPRAINYYSSQHGRY